ncbi:MAG: ABC transporter substrate-binding protein [Chloroflexota bacterium]
MKRLISLLFVFACLVGAVSAVAQDEAPADETPPDVVLRVAGVTQPTGLDPLVLSSAADVQFIPNIFLSLARIDAATGRPGPALARSWSIGLDGLTWTFNLRDDVPWVIYDPTAGTFENLRPVTAADAVFAIQRMCSSDQYGPYATDILGSRIAGCADGQAAGDGTLAQVEAPDDITLIITLNAPYAYFDSLVALWTIAPLPEEALVAAPNDWTEPGRILTNGAFAVAAFTPQEALTLVANPLLPDDLRGEGGITRVEYIAATDERAAFRRYTDGLADVAAVPVSQRDVLLADEALAPEIYEVSNLSLFYLGFATDLPPFDDMHLRRAFAAAFDRQRFIEEVRGGRGRPFDHLIPAEVSPGVDVSSDLLLGFDPDFAREQLALSAYPECAGLPPVRIATYEDASGWAGFLVDSAVEVLGCDAAAFDIQALDFNQLRATIDPDTDPGTRPALFTFGWGPDYDDASSYVAFVACGTENYFGRQNCTLIDDLILQASTTAEAAQRVTLYQQIELALFGPDGEMPLIPLFLATEMVAVKPWVSGPVEAFASRFGVTYYDAFSIDTEARAATVSCTVISPVAVNLRGGPGTNFNQVGTLEANTPANAVGQTRGTDSFIWWLLENGQYVREDVVEESGLCSALPEAQ